MLPYTSYDVDKGGNTALMAPEIINQQPGTFSLLNYAKSDLWAAGTIAYEIFGCVNPFYGTKDGKLRSGDYKEEELPELPDEVPFVLKKLVENCLRRIPNQVLSELWGMSRSIYMLFFVTSVLGARLLQMSASCSCGLRVHG